MKPRTLPKAVLLLAVSVGGCHRCGPEKPATDPPEAAKPTPTLTVATLVGESTVLPRGVAAKTLTVPPVTVTPKMLGDRPYVIVTPKAVKPGPLPLVLVMHGDGGNAKRFHEEWPFELASQNDAYLVYLEGRGMTWDLETLKDNLDVKYAEAVIDQVVSTLPIDRTHIFATGYSSGGFFANVLACHRPSLLRAIASNAGGAPYNQAESWPNGYPKCPNQAPVATLVLHGDHDGTVTHDSGRFNAEYWAYVNGCNAAEMETTGYAECRAYKNCKPGKAVAFCTIPGLDHWIWEEGPVAIWTFFQKQ